MALCRCELGGLRGLGGLGGLGNYDRGVGLCCGKGEKFFRLSFEIIINLINRCIINLSIHGFQLQVTGGHFTLLNNSQ